MSRLECGLDLSELVIGGMAFTVVGARVLVGVGRVSGVLLPEPWRVVRGRVLLRSSGRASLGRGGRSWRAAHGHLGIALGSRGCGAAPIGGGKLAPEAGG